MLLSRATGFVSSGNLSVVDVNINVSKAREIVGDETATSFPGSSPHMSNTLYLEKVERGPWERGLRDRPRTADDIVTNGNGESCP